MNKFADTIIEKCLSLEQVLAYYHMDTPDDCEYLLLNFGLHSLVIKVLAEDDSLSYFVDSKEVVDPDFMKRDISNSLLWRESISRPIRWFWELTNQQGYKDGIQIEFSKNVHDKAIVIQLIGIASSIKFFSVTSATGHV